MSTYAVTMSKTEPPVEPVPSTSKAALKLESGATPPFSWTKNDKALTPAPDPASVSHDVSPTAGKDDTYKVVDKNGDTFTAVVAWKPDVPRNSTLTPGKGSASVTWTANANEAHVAYYEVDLKDSDEQRPTAVQLPRRVKQGASKKHGNKRVVSLDGLPPNFYIAHVRAIRNGDHGLVKSDVAKTDQVEVLPTSGPYPRWARVVLFIAGLVALIGVVVLLLTGPGAGEGEPVSLDTWALGVAALVVLCLVLFLSVIIRIRDLLTGPDNRVSTSRINVAIWTVVIAFGIATLAAFAFGAHQYHKMNPCALEDNKQNKELIKIDGICVDGQPIAKDQFDLDSTFKNGLAPNYLVLLGAPFVTLAGSAYIVNRQVDSGDRQKVASQGPSSYVDALSNDDGSADLVDSQYLIFTGVLLFYFLTSFIPNPSVLPDLPWGLVGLTGVSAGSYLLNKSVGANGLSVQGLVSSSVKEGESARVIGRNFLPEGSDGLVNGGLSVQLSSDTRTYTPTISKVSNTDVTFAANVPPNTYGVSLTTAANVSASAGALTVSP